MPLPADILSLPMRIRLSLWMIVGSALGLPVDELVEAINLDLRIAKRTLGNSRVRMTIAERLRRAHLSLRLGEPFTDLRKLQ